MSRTRNRRDAPAPRTRRASALGLTLAVLTCGALVPHSATAAPVGEITYADCYTAHADACGPGKSGIPKMSDATDVAVSPDGRNVYVATFGDSAVTHFDRDPAAGALTRVDCVTATTGCGLPNDSKPGLTNPGSIV